MKFFLSIVFICVTTLFGLYMYLNNENREAYIKGFTTAQKTYSVDLEKAHSKVEEARSKERFLIKWIHDEQIINDKEYYQMMEAVNK